MRTIKATFEISEDNDLAGVKFTCGKKTIAFDDLTDKEQVKMLNAWGGHYRLFYETYFGDRRK